MDRRSALVNAPRRALLLAVALAGLGACSYLPSAAVQGVPGAGLFDSPRQFRGHVVDDEQVSQIVAGVTSRADVEALLGSPSATGTFESNEWFYIGGVTRQRPARTLQLVEQRVVMVRFNNAGTVQEVRRLGLEDRRDIQVVERVTPSPGTERSFMQQLFGNIGRVGGGLGQTPQTQPGGPSPSGR
jgi:outer membrane protein assembly factor BamE (lipoprotein component of BamABCDE complex)